MEIYSVINDFGGIVPNVGQLDIEINSSNITKNLYGVTTYDDVVEIVFDTTLSGSEKTTLDTLVAAHVPIYIPETPYSLDIIPRKNNFNNSNFKRLATNIFPGTTYATAKCVSYMSSSLTNYTIRILDKNNQQILAEATFANTTENVQDIGVLTNLPSDTTQIEISAKVTGGGKAYLESLIICYE